MSKKYPIAEQFTSPQGEGAWTGTLMTFVRLAGCSVGKKLTEIERSDWRAKVPFAGKGESDINPLHELHSPLHIYTERCCTAWGTEFLCDTDFRTRAAMTPQEILDQVPVDVKRVMITGGEPLNHNLRELIEQVELEKKFVHIETSGTVPFPDDVHIGRGSRRWVAVSPKKGCLVECIDQADEIKLLVDETFDPVNLSAAIHAHPLVWLQPINFENDLDESNLKLCLEWQKQFPDWRVSTQAHKTWRVR